MVKAKHLPPLLSHSHSPLPHSHSPLTPHSTSHLLPWIPPTSTVPRHHRCHFSDVASCSFMPVPSDSGTQVLSTTCSQSPLVLPTTHLSSICLARQHKQHKHSRTYRTLGRASSISIRHWQLRFHTRAAWLSLFIPPSVSPLCVCSATYRKRQT